MLFYPFYLLYSIFCGEGNDEMGNSYIGLNKSIVLYRLALPKHKVTPVPHLKPYFFTIHYHYL